MGCVFIFNGSKLFHSQTISPWIIMGGWIMSCSTFILNLSLPLLSGVFFINWFKDLWNKEKEKNGL
jgi:hypothetical protein